MPEWARLTGPHRFLDPDGTGLVEIIYAGPMGLTAIRTGSGKAYCVLRQELNPVSPLEALARQAEGG